MKPLVVVENPARWAFEPTEIEVVTAKAYLTEGRYVDVRRAAVFNLCRRYGYQSLGYYVSLLAEARGHRPIPSVSTLRTLGSPGMVRLISDDLQTLVERSLSPLKSDQFLLSIYFGRNLARRYDALARALFNELPAPFLRARFSRDKGGWKLVAVRPIPTSEIPEDHRSFALEQARRYFRRPAGPARPDDTRYDLAILWRKDDPSPPSNERAIRKFVRTARECGIRAQVIGPDDAARVAEYDALFIRETTAVEHHTYRMARRAAWEGMVVIDDPESIIRCSNKVYQAELFGRTGLPTPKTLVVHEGNAKLIATEVGLPCVLKRPDGAFSRGVVKADRAEDLERTLAELFRESELVVAQEWTPSSFDWRVGVLDGEPLYACRYHMAPGHWQIVQSTGGRNARYGKVEAVPMEGVPTPVVEIARTAARHIGGGLYGVDIKDVDGRLLLVEVNDNPNLDAGYEDGVLKDELYLAVMRSFRRRLDARGSNGSQRGVR